MDDKYFELEKKANGLRRETLDMCIRAGTGHVTSSMSCADILTVLYYTNILKHNPKNPEWEDRDRFILSKGQASPVLYVILADRGFFPKERLSKFAYGDDGHGKNAPFGVHLQCDVPGVEFTTGSLGHGLGYATGVAEIAKIDNKDFFAFSLLGDGELYEGSNWEVAQYASHYKLDNLVAIVDRNEMCTNNYTEKIVALEPLTKRWEAYGWKSIEINGHSAKEIYETLEWAKSTKDGKPIAIVARTKKGRGIASMTDKLFKHGIAPKGEEAVLAKREFEEFAAMHLKNRGYNGN